MKEDINFLKLAKYCSTLRKDGQSQKVIEITNEIINNEENLYNKIGFERILCTRGAAFRDIGNHKQALKLAKEAINISPDSHHPYNLAGAACINLGRINDGEKYFKLAIEKGETIERVKRLKNISHKQHEIINQKNNINAKIKFNYNAEEDCMYDKNLTYYDEEIKLILEEFLDYTEDMHRLHEEGWFYSDNDDC